MEKIQLTSSKWRLRKISPNFDPGLKVPADLNKVGVAGMGGGP